MRLNRSLAIGGIIGVTGILLGFVGGVYSQRQAALAPLNQRIAADTGVAEADVAKVMEALGRNILASLKKGGKEEVKKLGKFRIIRIPEHRDLAEEGRPVTVPAKNYLVFESTVDVDVNGEGVTPAETVPQFQYNLLKDQTPSQKTPKTPRAEDTDAVSRIGGQGAEAADNAEQNQ